MVDEINNRIFMDPQCNSTNLCSNKYPFQKWGGSAPYKGLITNPEGKFLKIKFENIDIPCPYKPIEILSNWNNGEYGDGKDLHLPIGNYILKNNTWKYNKYKITDNDKLKLFYTAKELDANNYESFWKKYYSN